MAGMVRAVHPDDDSGHLSPLLQSLIRSDPS
jgi:hypothetical protein